MRLHITKLAFSTKVQSHPELTDLLLLLNRGSTTQNIQGKTILNVARKLGNINPNIQLSPNERKNLDEGLKQFLT